MSTCEARGGRECRGQGWGQGPGRHSAVLADLPGSQSHFGVLGLAELRQLLEDGRQLVRQRGVTAAELVLQCTMARLGPLAAGWLHPTRAMGIRPKAPKWQNAAL